MAPPLKVGNPQRSLVRIPGSGFDKTLKPICLEVAQISNFTKSLNEITNFDFSLPPELALSGTINVSPPPGFGSTVGESQGRTSEQTQEPDTGTRRKRPQVDDVSSANKRSAASSAHRANASLRLEERKCKMKTLLEEKEKLTIENNELKRKLAMFKEIIRSRSKLREFQEALQELSCQG